MSKAINNQKPPYVVPDELDLAPWDKKRSLLWIAMAFGLLFLATLLLIAPKIQHQLSVQTWQRLEDAGIDQSQLDLDWNYRDLTVSGSLPSDVTEERFISIVRGSSAESSAIFANGIRHLRLNFDGGSYIAGSFSDEALGIKVLSDGNTVKLNGILQNSEQKELLLQASLQSGIPNVMDEVEFKSEATTPMMMAKVSLLAEMLKQITPEQIEHAEISMSEDNLNYQMLARNKQAVNVIENVARSEIDNFRVTGGVDFQSKVAHNILAQSDGEQITLSGEIRSETHRKRLVFAATEAVGSANVIDQLVITNPLPESNEAMPQIDSMAAVISRLASGIDGKISLKGNDLSVSANVASEPVQQYLLTATQDARYAGLTVVENISLLTAADDSQALQSQLDELIDEVRATVVFPSGATTLSARAKQTLDKVASHISAYPDLLVEIEGHTDNVGRANVNEQLSQKRANAVRSYLAQSAVDGGRLIAVGYGHRKPIEENDTAAGRQANRRVHFTVLKRPG